MWVFRNKMDEEGKVIRNKARLLAESYSQQRGIDYDENFAPVPSLWARSPSSLDFKLNKCQKSSSYDKANMPEL